MQSWVFLATFISTVFCTAVNVYTWQIGYPVWRFVGVHFAAVHQEYMRKLNLVITVPHVVMFFASLVLTGVRPAWVPAWSALIVFWLNAAVILTSIVVAGPVHGRFSREGVADEPGMNTLLRVSAWRSGMLLISSGVLVWRAVSGLSR